MRAGFGLLVAGVAAITLARITALWFARTDLFVDEAQYWLWGQHLALGYYSKPPMIGWVIRGVTELAGSDSAFFVRVAAPVFHGATALILGWIALQLSGRAAALVVGLGYLTLPMVAVGSLLISTDTIMFPFLAGALAVWLRVLARPSGGLALIAGGLLGLAFLSKYAAAYYLLGAALAAAFVPGARPRRGDAALGFLGFLLAIAPNLVWNIQNGFSTVQHTLDNADWVRDPGQRAGFNLASMAEFFFSQFAVFGPIAFAVLVLAALGMAGRAEPMRRHWLCYALPALAVVTVQALLSKAYANWAASAYLTGSLLVFVILLGHRRWLVASFAINGAVALALPLMATQADVLRHDGRLLLSRYMGRAEVSTRIIEAARSDGLTQIVAENRDILADLFYTGRDSGLAFRAVPPRRRAPHHYALAFPFEGGVEEVAFVSIGALQPACAATPELLATIDMAEGAYRGRPVQVWRLKTECVRSDQ